MAFDGGCTGKMRRGRDRKSPREGLLCLPSCRRIDVSPCGLRSGVSSITFSRGLKTVSRKGRKIR